METEGLPHIFDFRLRLINLSGITVIKHTTLSSVVNIEPTFTLYYTHIFALSTSQQGLATFKGTTIIYELNRNVMTLLVCEDLTILCKCNT